MSTIPLLKMILFRCFHMYQQVAAQITLALLEKHLDFNNLIICKKLPQQDDSVSFMLPTQLRILFHTPTAMGHERNKCLDSSSTVHPNTQKAVSLSSRSSLLTN